MMDKRPRTNYPAIRLWRAELAARVEGQDPYDPTTWHWDPLFHAMLHELEAFNLRGDGPDAKDDALRHIRGARACFAKGLNGKSTVNDELWESGYREALHNRAVRTLGMQQAEALTLNERPRRHQPAHRGRRSGTG